MTSWQALEEGARRLKIDGSKIYRLAREGDLPTHWMGRVWRFDAKELDGWLKAERNASNTPGQVSSETNEALSVTNKVKDAKYEARNAVSEA